MERNLVQLTEHFGNDARYATTEAARRRQWFIKARTDKLRREEMLDQAEDAMLATATVAVVATDIQIREFERRLDLYDEATIKALNENRIRMDEVKHQLPEVDILIQGMLDRAYVMEDGRRVFLTEDRTQAFDENGVEVSPDELDFDLVPPSATTWEDISGARREKDTLQQELDRLEAEQRAILDYQEKLDQAREQIANGTITTQELDDLDAELSDAMPPSVRKHTPGFDTAHNAPDLKSSFTAPVTPALPKQMDAAIKAAPIPE